MKLIHLFLLVVMAIFYACHRAPLESEYPFEDIENSTFDGLLFSAHKEYQSSKIYWYDFKAGKIEGILQGQSGDPKIFVHQKKALLFNRSKSRSNLVILDPEKNFEASSEQALQLGYGEPHSVASLDEKTLLLSCHDEKSLRSLDLKSYQHKLIYKNEDFVPGSLYLQKSEEDLRVFTLSLDTVGIDYTDSQKIYGLSLTKPGFRLLESSLFHKKTRATYGDNFFSLQSTPDILYSFHLGNSKLNGCKGSFESFKLGETIEVEILSKLKQFSHFSQNGTSVAGKDNHFYVSLDNTDQNNVTELHLFTLESNGSLGHKLIKRLPYQSCPPLLVYDQSNDVLIFGEGKYGSSGNLHLYKNNELISSKEIDFVPYQGVLL